MDWRLRKKLVIANWKMNGSFELCQQFAERAIPPKTIDVGIAPPALYVNHLRSLANKAISIGVQNVNENAQGAFTGEISATMAYELGARFAIVGHSERRTIYHEGDSLVAAKLNACIETGITPVICIGESLQHREQGKAQHVVEEQIKAVIQHCGDSACLTAEFAYEPIWAIGTGQVATPEDAQDMHSHIRNIIACATGNKADQLRILYGGSVKADNAAALIAQSDIDGFLIGGASLQVGSFNRICQIASGG